MTTAYMCRCFVNKETTYFSSCDINDIKLPKHHSELGYFSHYYYFIFIISFSEVTSTLIFIKLFCCFVRSYYPSTLGLPLTSSLLLEYSFEYLYEYSSTR